MTQMQGIVSILRSDNPEKLNKAASLRRTLSADMSSKWFADNGCPTMKKIESSEQIAIDLDEEECELKGKGDQNPTRVDIWTAIMSQKKQDDSGKLPPPYVHPLVKKSRSLSEKSLKICTESLGSETGSDVFSAPPACEKAGSETGSDVFSSKPVFGKTGGDEHEEKEEHKVVKPAGLPTKKAQQARSFPPPLPSLAAARTEGPSLHMHSRRVDGRLVVEAVSVPQQKYFEAQRQDGRFLLTLINEPKEDEQPSKPYNNNTNKLSSARASYMCGVQEVSGQLGSSGRTLTLHFGKNLFPQLEPITSKSHDNSISETDEDEMVTGFSDNDLGILKFRPLNPTSAVINVHKSTVTIKRFLERDNENPSWSRKLEILEEEEAPITQTPTLRQRANGLPPLPPPAATTTVNSYQYFWRAKPTVASLIDPMITQHRPPTKTKDLVLLRGNKADCFLPSLKGCKEPRRSLLMWEPFCIATS